MGKTKLPTLTKAAQDVLDAEDELHVFPTDAEEVFPGLCKALGMLRKVLKQDP